jgi:hypothetical protein
MEASEAAKYAFEDVSSDIKRRIDIMTISGEMHAMHVRKNGLNSIVSTRTHELLVYFPCHTVFICNVNVMLCCDCTE